MNTFFTSLNAAGMKIDVAVDGLTQQWIDRHNAQRAQFYAAIVVDGREEQQLVEFDDYMDYRDELSRNMRLVVEWRVAPDNQAAIAEGCAIEAVLTGYRYNHNISRRNWLVSRGYVNVPELYRDPAPAGEFDYEFD